MAEFKDSERLGMKLQQIGSRSFSNKSSKNDESASGQQGVNHYYNRIEEEQEQEK
jgi:hypothetical protein